MASRLDEVQAALVTLFTAALPGVAVYDDDALTAENDDRFVIVGDDWDPESDSTSTFEQEWADLACSSRYERGSIPCAAGAITGDDDTAAVRAAAFAVVAACETTLRADRTLAGLVLIAQLASGSVQLLQTTRGPFLVAQFEITYMAQV